MRTLNGLLVNDASLLGHHGSALVTAQARRLAEKAGITLQTGLDWTAVEETLQERHGFDVVIVNGEGSIHHDSKTAQRIARLGHSLAGSNTPAFLINASEEANGADIYEGLAKYRSVYVRDQSSQASLARAGLASRVVHDLTLTWDSGVVAQGKGRLMVTDAADNLQALELFAFASRIGATPFTLRTAPPWTLQRWQRRAGFELKRLAARVRGSTPWALRYAGAIRDFDTLVSHLVNDASGLVSGRFHAVCLALRLELPFIAVSAATSKIGSLLSDIGLQHRLVDLMEISAAKSGFAVTPFDEKELASIRDVLRRTEADAQAMFNDIASHVRSGSCRNC